MGFASGFRAGYDVVSAAEERRRKEELRKGLQRESARFTPTEVASGEEALRGFREGTAQTDTFTIPNADGSGGLTVTPAQYEQMYLSDLQNRPAGYTVEQAVVPELGGRQYETLAAAEQAVAPSRAAGLANVYRQAGDVAEAEQLMGLSRGAQLQNLQISAAQRTEEDALKVRTATEQIAKLGRLPTLAEIRTIASKNNLSLEQQNQLGESLTSIASQDNALKLQTATEQIAALGRPPTLKEVRQIASANSLSLDQQFKLGENVTGIASQDAKELEIDIKKKIKGKGLDALLKIHKDDPTFDDNSFFEKSVDKDGKITITQKSNDGAIIGSQSFPSAEAATKYLNQAAIAPENLFTWLQANRLSEAGIAKATEQTLLAKAQRLGLPAAAQTDAQRQNIALADQFRKQIADANKLLENYREGTPQYNAVLAERNSAAMALKDVNRLFQSGGLTRSEAAKSQVNIPPEVDASIRAGINPKTKEPYTADEIKAFEERTGISWYGPKPEANKAGLSKPVGDPTKPLPPGLVGSNVDVRAERAKETQARKAAEKAAQKAAEEQATARRKEEVVGLTADRIKALKPSEAASILRQYNTVITREQRKLLNQQM